MTLGLHNLRPVLGSKKKKKRVGRGNASGHGTTATRGTKGQKSRAGSGGFKRRGLSHILRATPKFKGQKGVSEKFVPVNLDILEKHFEAGEIIDHTALVKKGIIKFGPRKVKILGSGNITKAFTVYAPAFSKKAEAAIVKAGGKVKLLNPKS